MRSTDNEGPPPIYLHFAERGGWRTVVLFHHGRKWIRLLDTATFEVYTLHVNARRRLRSYHMSPRQLARRLTARRATFRRCNVRFSKRAVQAALRVLNTQQ